MFLSGKKIKQMRNSFNSKIQFLMTRNFFTVDEFKSLKFRKALKVIKLIAKAEGLKLNKNEAVELVSFIKAKDHLKNVSNAVVKLFKFAKSYVVAKAEAVINKVVKLVSYIINFRINFKKVLRV